MSRMFQTEQMKAEDYQVGDLTNGPDGTQYRVTRRMVHTDGSLTGLHTQTRSTLSTILEEFK